MAILTPTDLALLAPDLDTDPGQVNAIIQQAQMIAEGPNGANRPLEIQEFIETPVLNGRGFCKLSRIPILEGESYPVTVEIRGRRMLANFGLPLADNQWISLSENSDYEVDYQLGEIRILHANAGGIDSTWSYYGGRRSIYSTRPFRRPTEERTSPEMRIKYTTGFDFQANPIDPRAQEIKIAVAAIARLQQSSLASGLKQYQVTDFYSMTFSADSAAMVASAADKTLLQDILMVLKRYRPREFAV
jgi:hypothetical protein